MGANGFLHELNLTLSVILPRVHIFAHEQNVRKPILGVSVSHGFVLHRFSGLQCRDVFLDGFTSETPS